MKTLKTLALIGVSALAVSAVSVAAQAQPYGGYGYGHDRNYGGGYDRDDGYGRADYRATTVTLAEVDRLDLRIFREAQNHVIRWDEARALRSQLRDVRPLAWRAQTGAANRWEVGRLEAAFNRIDAQVPRYPYGR